jgi:2-polyprenyl-6-methoxyphenol hydroxylase-like FAD-dependent oxidoreductase
LFVLHVPEFRPCYDVIIVGARCAGAATALLLAKAGVRVLAIDRDQYASDTLSTHALMRPAVVQLSRWGLLEPLIRSGAPIITTTTFHYGEDEVTIPIKPEPGIPGLVAPRRTVLDRMLVDAARAAGATILHDSAVQDLNVDAHGRVRGVFVKNAEGRTRTVVAGHVVGADGLWSTVARKVQAATVVRGRASLAHIFGYAAAPELSGYHWYFRPDGGGGIIPTNDGLACIVVSVPTARFDREFRGNLAAGRLAALTTLSPELARHTAAHDVERLKAFRGAQGILRQAFGNGWSLVGDAGFFRDPLTSHGISDALRDAEGTASAILSGAQAAFAHFQDERDSLALPILEATDAISSFGWSLAELPELHKKFSEAMKAEIAVLARRAAHDRALPHPFLAAGLSIGIPAG